MNVLHHPLSARWQRSRGRHRPRRLRLAAPWRFFDGAGAALPWFAGAALAFGAAGFALGLARGAATAEQRVLLVHLPAAWTAVLIGFAFAGAAAVGLRRDASLARIVMCALAPTGASMALLALVSGMPWSGPAGDGWSGTSGAHPAGVAALLIVFTAFVALHGSLADLQRADRVAGTLALAGIASLAVLHGALLGLPAWPMASDVAAAAPLALPAMTLGLLAYTVAVTLQRARLIVVERERRALMTATEGPR